MLLRTRHRFIPNAKCFINRCFLVNKTKMFIGKKLLEITSELSKNQQLIIDLWDIG